MRQNMHIKLHSVMLIQIRYSSRNLTILYETFFDWSIPYCCGINPIVVITAKMLWRFNRSECTRVTTLQEKASSVEAAFCFCDIKCGTPCSKTNQYNADSIQRVFHAFRLTRNFLNAHKHKNIKQFIFSMIRYIYNAAFHAHKCWNALMSRNFFMLSWVER